MAGATPNGPIKLDIELPDVATFSVHQKLSDQWEMMGDVAWTGWAKIPRLSIFRANGTLLSNTEGKIGATRFASRSAGPTNTRMR